MLEVHLLLQLASWGLFLKFRKTGGIPISKPRVLSLTNEVLFSFMPTFFTGYNIVTNLVSSRRAHQEMLGFAARNNIHPVIEKFPFSNEGIAAGIEKLTNGKIRYRAVLVW